MKRLATIILVLYGYLGNCQELGNFMIENNQLVWQKVYETDADKSTIESSINSKIKERFTVEEDQITGRIIKSNFKAYLKSLGMSSVNTAIILWRGEYDATIRLEFKEGRYRVTLTDIRNYEYSLGESSETQSAINRKGQYKGLWKNNVGKYLDLCFEDLFAVKEVNQSDEW